MSDTFDHEGDAWDSLRFDDPESYRPLVCEYPIRFPAVKS